MGGPPAGKMCIHIHCVSDFRTPLPRNPRRPYDMDKKSGLHEPRLFIHVHCVSGFWASLPQKSNTPWTRIPRKWWERQPWMIFLFSQAPPRRRGSGRDQCAATGLSAQKKCGRLQWGLGHKKPSTRNPTLKPQDAHRCFAWEGHVLHCMTTGMQETQGTLDGNRMFLGMGSHCRPSPLGVKIGEPGLDGSRLEPRTPRID